MNEAPGLLEEGGRVQKCRLEARRNRNLLLSISEGEIGKPAAVALHLVILGPVSM